MVLLLTCTIRDSAEQKVWERLEKLKSIKRIRPHGSPLQIGILGLWAEEQCIGLDP